MENNIDKRVVSGEAKNVEMKQSYSQIIPNPLEKRLLFGKFAYYRLAPLREPVAFVMRSNKRIEIRENVKLGKMVFIDPETQKIKGICLLTPEKMQSIEWAGKEIKAFVVSEDEATAYPIDKVHDPKEVYQFIDMAIMNKKLLEKQPFFTPEMKKWIIIGIVVVVGIWAVNKFILTGDAPAVANVVNGAKDIIDINSIVK